MRVEAYYVTFAVANHFRRKIIETCDDWSWRVRLHRVYHSHEVELLRFNHVADPQRIRAFDGI